MGLYITHDKDGNKIFIKGELGPHCADCADVAANLCDYPIGGGKTCDKLMCESHSHKVGNNTHYCDDHFEIFKRENKNFYPKILVTSKRNIQCNDNGGCDVL